MDGSAIIGGGEMISSIDNVAWLAEQIKRHPYAEITIHVTVHDGQVRQVERVVAEKIRPEK